MTKPLTLRTALGNYGHVRALKDGTVASERLRLDFVEVEPVTRAFRRMVRGLEFDLCEIALATHAQAHAAGIPITALPIVLMRGFHHGAIVCMRGSDVKGPADLIGRRVGVRAYSQTTGVWVRGILHTEYGLDPDTITWVTEEDAHVLQYRDPPNVMRLTEGQSLVGMLRDGQVDAVIAVHGLGADEVRTVIAHSDDAAAAWYRKTRIYPANHVIAVRGDLLREHPWLADEVFRMFAVAKAARPPAAGGTGVMALVGDDPLPYGMAANRASFELLLAFAARHGLVEETYRAGQLFALDST